MENLYQYGLYILIVIVVVLGLYLLRLRAELSSIKRSKEKVIQEAYFNPISNLPNKKNIKYVFDEQIGRTLRHNRSFTVLAVKINNYQEVKKGSVKLANKLIQIASDIIIQDTRGEDLAAHVDDDVLIILFNEYLEGDNYHIVLDRLKDSFKKSKELQHEGIEFEISMGISTYPHDGKDSDSLIEKAISQAVSKQF
ncbi:MAG: diguanylate cyclase [Sulfurimonas sp.]